MPSPTQPSRSTRNLPLWWLTTILILLASPLSAQWVHEWTPITVDGSLAFALSDSTAVYAERSADEGYDITKRVWVEKISLSDETLAEGASLFNAKGKVMGTTRMALRIENIGMPTDRRMAKKYVTGLLKGHVRSSGFISHSWPERALVAFLTEKRIGPFWEGFSSYLNTFGFEQLKNAPSELQDAGLDAWVLRYQDRSNSDEQKFRMIVFTRGEVGIQCILTDQEVLTLPKLKLQESKVFGQLHHLAKPTLTQSAGYEYTAYAYIPLEDA